jgi:hypothetical protein
MATITATARESAETVAHKAQVAGKLAQARVRKRGLIKRVHTAESHLARSVMERAESGPFNPVDLEGEIRDLTDLDVALMAQSEEIVRLRHELSESRRGDEGADDSAAGATSDAGAGDTREATVSYQPPTV